MLLTQSNERSPSREATASPVCPFDATPMTLSHTYVAPPEVEVVFKFATAGDYHRQLFQCPNCLHFVSRHDMDMGSVYEGDYVDSNYRDLDGIRRTFERIINLPPDESDNKGRVRCVNAFAESHFGSQRFDAAKPSILDVGSGLCVFLHEMKAIGWSCTALDPDARSAAHAREFVGVEAISADFFAADISREFDVVTFNKVLEHVQDPVAMLAKSRDLVADDGFVYVELPDGEIAMIDGPQREEFTIDHLHAFSLVSLALTAQKAGFTVKHIERLQEPSTKYTLRAFLLPA